MSTSGSYNYNLIGTQIVTEAFEHAEVYDSGKTISGADMTTALRSLNLMVKSWQAEGIGLWLNKEITLLLSYQGYSYSVGPAGKCSTTVIKTEIATAAILGAGTITVDSDDGMSSGDNIGIELDDKTIQWTTINGAPVANVITLTAVLTGATAVDNHVYTYTTACPRPIEIIEVRRVNSDDSEISLLPISRSEYMSLTTKTTTGTPTQYWYDPQRTNGLLKIWPACSDVKERIKMSVKFPIEDFDSQGNDPDFPQEWLEALVFGLAVRLCSKFGREIPKALIALSTSAKERLFNFDGEDASIYFQPSMR